MITIITMSTTVPMPIYMGCLSLCGKARRLPAAGRPKPNASRHMPEAMENVRPGRGS
jgi:hypothetical protein